MKKTKTLFARFLTLIVLALMSTANVWGDTETFVAGTDKSDSSPLTKGKISISMSTLNRADNYRANSGTDLTISGGTDVTITKVEFTCTGSGTSDYGPGKMSLKSGSAGAYSYSGKIGTWTGSANSFTMHTSAQVRMTQIVVTYTDGTTPSTDPTLSVSPTSINFGTVEQNSTVNSKDITVTFANLTTNDIAASITGSAFNINKTSAFTTGDKITITPSTATVGNYSETLTVSGATDELVQEVTVTMNVVPVLTSIAVSGTPSKTTYEAGETFDPAGLTVTGYYSDETNSPISTGIDWLFDPEILTEGTTSVDVIAGVGEVISELFTVTNITVNAATPKIIIDGTATGITTTDEAQEITVDGATFGGKFKQYATTALWLTDGSGFLYNKESFGKIKKITINYKSGGSPAAYQWIRLGNTILNSYSKTITNGVKYETSTGGNSNTFNVEGDFEYFCISVSNKNLQASSIVIEYEETAPDTREMPTASFAEEVVNAVVNDYFIKTVTTNSGGTVTYSSSDDHIAMVDASTGKVHAISAGTATITADIEGTETYKPASASYTIVITSAPLTGKGTEAEPYTVEDIITLGSTGDYYWVSGTIVGFGINDTSGGVSHLNYTTDESTMTQSNFVISDGKGNIAAVELPSGKAIRTALNLPDHLNYIGAPIKVYGTLTKYFNQVGVKSTSEYRLTQQEASISSVGYATAYVPFDATVAGATAYYVTVNDDKAILNEITGTIPANTGVILNGEEGTATFTETTVAATTNVEDNKLIGFTENTEVNNSKAHYALSHKDGVVGFYIPSSCASDNDATASFTAAAYKAYLELDAPVSGAKLELSFDDVTGIYSVNGITDNKAIYNMQGVRVSENYKGVVIMNGKKYIK